MSLNIALTYIISCLKKTLEIILLLLLFHALSPHFCTVLQPVERTCCQAMFVSINMQGTVMSSEGTGWQTKKCVYKLKEGLS